MIQQPVQKLPRLQLPPLQPRIVIKLPKITQQILHDSFIYALIGVPGAGKTVFAQSLLSSQDFLLNCFDFVLLCSPSPYTGIEVGQNWYSPSFNLNWIAQKLRLINSIAQQKKLASTKTLIIIDDCIHQVNRWTQAQKDLFQNRRNLLNKGQINFLLLTQKFGNIPPFIRAIISAVFLINPTLDNLNRMSRQIIYLNKARNRDLILSACKQDRNQAMFDCERCLVRVNWKLINL